MNDQAKKPSLFWRIAISAIGIALILMAAGNFLLFLFGESATAATHTRRTGGSNYAAGNDAAYAWSIDYTFMAENGQTYEGHLTKRGSPTSVQVSKNIRYFGFAPFINTPADIAEPGLSQLVMLAIGIFLLFVMNQRKKSRVRN